MSEEMAKPVTLRLPKAMADRILAESVAGRRTAGGQVMYYVDIAFEEWIFIMQRDAQAEKDRLTQSGEADASQGIVAEEEEIRPLGMRYPRATYTLIERMAARERRSISEQTVYMIERVFWYWDEIKDLRLKKETVRHARRIELARTGEDDDDIRMPASFALALA